MKRILLADNDESFLDARAELLRQAGYSVLTAGSPSEAEDLLDESHVHLAIVDLRLKNDSNNNDRSGLDLAVNEAYSRIPKIILTQFPHYTTVRESLAKSSSGLPPAIDFLGKEEGIDALVAAINRAFEEHVRVNWNLRITFAEPSPGLTQLCEFLLPDIRSETLAEQTDEFEELLRRLFYYDDQIRIDKMLWKRRRTVALVVSSFSKESLPDAFLVICRSRDSSAIEAERFRRYAPKSSDTGQLVLDKSAETTQFGAICYRLIGASIEDLQSLAGLYNVNEKLFHTALKTMFGKTLPAWHQKSRLIEAEKPLDVFYRERLGLSLRESAESELKAKIESLGNRLPLIGSRVEFDHISVRLDLGGQSLSYPDPLLALFAPWDFPRPVPLIITPGAIEVDTVFAASADGIWLTDFALAGPAPLAWNHVALEAAVRFDLVRSTNLKWIYQLEQALVEGEFSRLYAEDMEGSLKKAMKAIQTIRKDATLSTGSDVAAYHLGIFFQAARRLAAYNPDSPMKDKELAPFAHLFLAMCMLGKRLREKRAQKETPLRSVPTIAIDTENRRVFIEGVPISLKGKGYQLLSFLYDRAGRLCDRKELFEAVFDETYDAADENQQSKLNTAIHRLREKIEDDAENPRYLLTDPGGYRLLLTEKK